MRSMTNELHFGVNGDSVVPLVTDDERGFEATDKYLPKVKRLLCWNHACHTVKEWLKQHGASSSTSVPITVQYSLITPQP